MEYIYGGKRGSLFEKTRAKMESYLRGRDRERDIQKARMGFLEMEPIFGQLKAEWSAPHTNPLRPFLLHVHGLPTDPPALRFHVTDFHSNTWEALKTEQDLEDMRDVTGIGGSWSDFLEYVLASIKSDDVKLVLEGDSVEQERCCHLSKAISVEQEKNETIQKQLDGFLYPKRQKLTTVTDKSKSDPASIMDSQNSPDGKAAQQPSTKVINRVVPTRRRAKVRGVLLQDTEDDAQN
nr:uncharacterized protein LOC109193792 [Ipomoea trifida]